MLGRWAPTILALSRDPGVLYLISRIMANDLVSADVRSAHHDFVATDAGSIADGGGLKLGVLAIAALLVAVREDPGE